MQPLIGAGLRLVTTELGPSFPGAPRPIAWEAPAGDFDYIRLGQAWAPHAVGAGASRFRKKELSVLYQLDQLDRLDCPFWQLTVLRQSYPPCTSQANGTSLKR
jgi:hypothetical protein